MLILGLVINLRLCLSHFIYVSYNGRIRWINWKSIGRENLNHLESRQRRC